MRVYRRSPWYVIFAFPSAICGSSTPYAIIRMFVPDYDRCTHTHRRAHRSTPTHLDGHIHRVTGVQSSFELDGCPSVLFSTLQPEPVLRGVVDDRLHESSGISILRMTKEHSRRARGACDRRLPRRTNDRIDRSIQLRCQRLSCHPLQDKERTSG